MSRYKRSAIDWKARGNFGRYLRLLRPCRGGRKLHERQSFAEAWASASNDHKLWFLKAIGMLGTYTTGAMNAHALLLTHDEIRLPPPAVVRAFRKFRNEYPW